MSQEIDVRAATEEQEGDIDMETALAAVNEGNDTDLEETDVEDTASLQGATTAAWRTASKPWPQTCDRASQWRKAFQS